MLEIGKSKILSTPCVDGIASNSDNSTQINVPSGIAVPIPDSQFDVNSSPIGLIISAKTTGVNLKDQDNNTITPSGIITNGNKFDIEINRVLPNGIAFQYPIYTQWSSYRPGDIGERIQNGWTNDLVNPPYPKVVSELDYSNPNFFNVLKNPLVVNGISSTTRFVDIDGGQTFSVTGNKHLVVIDKLSGFMYYRLANQNGGNWNDVIDISLNLSIVVGGITYDDWYLASQEELELAYHNYATILPLRDTLTNVEVLNGSGNIWTSSTYANGTTLARYYELATRQGGWLSKSTSVGSLQIRKAHNLITAP